MRLELNVDTKAVDQFLALSPKKTSLAVLRSLKRGTQAARTEGARTVSRDMGIRVSDARQAIEMTPPSSNTLAGRLAASLRRIRLIKFGAKGPIPSRGKGRGVTYRGEGGRRTLRSAFISPMKTGHVGVFKRAGAKRLPIRELYGPSIGRVLDRHRKPIADRGAEVAEKELDRQLNRIFGVKS